MKTSGKTKYCYTEDVLENNKGSLGIKCLDLLKKRTNETRHIKWHETCKCKCRLDENVCNNVGITLE